ncbi:hypothetical protein NAL19_388 [Pectobacterium sp. F1-1]|nr:hypothetical protein NAL19_388 [Pectobacterium sp. F1-1]
MLDIDTAEGEQRFIPAGAGNTAKSTHVVFSSSVYPRWRGEHRTIFPFLMHNSGLSPLARGTRCG